MPLSSLTWLPDERAILVDGHLRYDLANHVVSALPGDDAALSRDGRRVAGWSVDRLTVGWVDGGGVPVTAPAGPWTLTGSSVGRAAVWLDDSRVYVHVFDRDAGDVQCAILDVDTNAWSTPTACLAAALVHVTSIDPAPGGRVLVASVGEGSPILELQRYEGAATRTLKAPWGDVFPTGEVSVTWRADGTGDIVTSCALGRERPCMDADGAPVDAEWTWYRWKGAAVTPVVRGVAPWSVPSPSGTRLAWRQDQLVCVGDVVPGVEGAPTGVGDTTCVPVGR